MQRAGLRLFAEDAVENVQRASPFAEEVGQAEKGRPIRCTWAPLRFGFFAVSFRLPCGVMSDATRGQATSIGDA